MPQSSSHDDRTPPNTIRTREELNVKEKARYTNKKTLQIQIQGQLLMAMEEAAKQKHLTLSQYIRETLENELIRSRFLPDWWHTRQFDD